MGPSNRAFNQAKSILGKLDRSIDQLREQRAAGPVPVPASPAVSAATALSQQIGGRAEPTPARPASPFGRATPLPPRS
jgi:hypothetical protein